MYKKILASIQNTEDTSGAGYAQVPVPPQLVGYIIGKSGHTIKEFQIKFEVSIWIKKNIVRIRGPRENVLAAAEAIKQLIEMKLPGLTPVVSFNRFG